jgi:type IV secretion system protein VirB9
MALETPQPCSKADQRVRCVAYNQTQVVRLYAAPGAALTVEFASGEKIVDASTSDNGLIAGAEPSDRMVMQVSDAGPATADRNLQMAKRGSFLFLKPLRQLVPQPVAVLTQREDGKYRRYSFQLETRPGTMDEETPNTFYAVRFTYPEDEAEKLRAQWADLREAQQAGIVSDRLRQNGISGPSVVNARYSGQGTETDRAALAPASANSDPAIWDDGQRTYLRYPGNRRVPMIYQVLPDGREGVAGQSADADPTTHGTLVTLHGVFPSLRLRNGKSVLCIVNERFDPTGRNPGTGTTTPDVVRTLAPRARTNVR